MNAKEECQLILSESQNHSCQLGYALKSKGFPSNSYFMDLHPQYTSQIVLDEVDVTRKEQELVINSDQENKKWIFELKTA